MTAPVDGMVAPTRPELDRSCGDLAIARQLIDLGTEACRCYQQDRSLGSLTGLARNPGHTAPEVGIAGTEGPKAAVYAIASSLLTLAEGAELPAPLERLLRHGTAEIPEHRPGPPTFTAELRRVERRLPPSVPPRMARGPVTAARPDDIDLRGPRPQAARPVVIEPMPVPRAEPEAQPRVETRPYQPRVRPPAPPRTTEPEPFGHRRRSWTTRALGGIAIVAALIGAWAGWRVATSSDGDDDDVASWSTEAVPVGGVDANVTGHYETVAPDGGRELHIVATAGTADGQPPTGATFQLVLDGAEGGTKLAIEPEAFLPNTPRSETISGVAPVTAGGEEIVFRVPAGSDVLGLVVVDPSSAVLDVVPYAAFGPAMSPTERAMS